MVVRSIQVQAVRPHEPDHPQQQSTEPPTAVQRTRRMPAAQQQRRIPLTTGTAVLLLVLLCSSVLLPSSLTSPALFRPVRGQPPSDTILAGPGVLCGPTQECECAAGYEQMLVTNATALVGNTYNCTKCALGSASTGGGVRCTLCDAGTRSLQGLSCEACGQNTYQPAAGSTACLSCVPNASTSSQTGQRQCSCNNGYQQSLVTSNNVVTLQCTKCATGSITNVNGTCVQCAAGTRSLEGGTCEPCGQNTYQPSPGSTTCIPCAPNASTYSQTGSSRCMCNAGFQESYIAVNNTQTLQCNTCPDGAECISGNGVAKAKAGYWYDSETQGYFACPNNYCCDASTGGAGCAVTDPNRCYPHRHGFLCGDCDVGYSSISGRDCVSCSSPNGPLLVILVILGLLFIGLCLAENPSEDASTKLIVDYIQMCSLILNPNIGINEILALVNLQFGSATAKFNACVLPLPPILGISAGSLIPFALFFLLGLIHLIHWLVAHYGPRGKRLAWTVWYDANRWRYTNCAWEITLFGFMAIVSACVQLLNCQHIGYHYVVSLAPSVECFSDAHFGVAIVALILFCVLTFVVPIWLVSMLSHLTKTTQRRSSVFLHSMRQIKQLKKDYKRQKKAMKKSQRDSIIQQGEELDQKIMDIDEFLQRQLQQTAKVTRTGHEIALWCYHADKYWCEAAFFLRRVIFTLVTVLLIREKAAMIITWFCILILVFHARFPVFRKQSSSYFHDFCLGAIVFQSALNLDIYAADPTGYVDFSSVSKRAQVVIVYGVTLLPILVGLSLFIKEFFKERIRKKHAVMKKPAAGGDELEAVLAEEDSEEEDELDTFGSAVDGSRHARTTNEHSASSGGSHRRAHSPSIAGVAGDLTMGVLAQGPNVSTRVYNNAPIDLDAVLSSLTGAVISTPQFPNNHHPPVTIHF